MLAIIDRSAYAAAFASCQIANADVNGDGLVNNFDIQPLADLIVGP